MTQSECLASPSHFVHLGVCYPGANATIQLSSPDHPQAATFTATSVPEPPCGALFALALVLSLSFARIRPRGGACAVLAIASCAAGCATPPPSASDQVRVTTTLADVAGCTLLGKVFVADGPNAEKDARAKTASVGGNVLLRKGPDVWNGNAYQCSAGTR